MKIKSGMFEHKNQQGFTLIEVMIVVAIIGIIAAIALPSYNNYITRAKLDEGLHFLERAKLAVNIYHQDGEDVTALKHNETSSYTALGLKRNIDSKYFDQYWIAPWNSHDITIWVKAKSSAELPTDVQGKWPVYLVGKIQNREIKWTCKSDYNEGLSKYAPVKCR